jgi:hypothetical protein
MTRGGEGLSGVGRGHSLHDRAAKALGWTVEETQSMSLQSLREQVRFLDKSLADDITDAIESGRYITRRGVEGFGTTDRINQSDYTHYVVVRIRGTQKIESGWSYKEDASEHMRENMPGGLRTDARVLTSTGARRAGLNPNNNADWFGGSTLGFQGLGSDDDAAEKLALWERTGPRPPYLDPTDPEPDMETLEEWVHEGGAETTDGCWVEPDGYCEHAHVSWLVYLGMI